MLKTKNLVALALKGRNILTTRPQLASALVLNSSVQQQHHSTWPRKLSTILTPKDELRDFMAIFPDIIRDLTEDKTFKEAPEVGKWISEVMQYNVPNGKKNRGLTLITSYKALKNISELTPEDIRLAIIMGWCVEIFQAVHLMMDDIINGSKIRRSMPCWHQKVGLSAINDATLLQASMFTVLKRYFEGQPYYLDAIHIFNDMCAKTCIGELLALQISKGEKPDLTRFTMKYYNTIVKYMTSYYTYQMPVILAMMMAGTKDPEVYRQANTILLEIGEYFQIQNDYIDCFGDPAATGRMANDIKTGRCTWLAVVALQRVNQNQRKTMEQYYGTGNDADAEKIKSLYVDLGLPSTYNAYENKTNEDIIQHIQQTSRGLPHKIFLDIMTTIYGRKS